MPACAPSAWSCCGSCTRRRAREQRRSGRRRPPRWRTPAAWTNPPQPQLERCAANHHSAVDTIYNSDLPAAAFLCPRLGHRPANIPAGGSYPMGRALESVAGAVLDLHFAASPSALQGTGPKVLRLLYAADGNDYRLAVQRWWCAAAPAQGRGRRRGRRCDGNLRSIQGSPV